MSNVQFTSFVNIINAQRNIKNVGIAEQQKVRKQGRDHSIKKQFRIRPALQRSVSIKHM